MLLLPLYTDLSNDLMFVLRSCFFDHPSIDSNKKISLSPFKGCFEVSSLFLLCEVKDLSVDVTELVIVVTKSAPDLLKTELRLHVVVHVFAMNL